MLKQACLFCARFGKELEDKAMTLSSVPFLILRVGSQNSRAA